MFLLYSYIYELKFCECFAFSLFPKHGVYFICKYEWEFYIVKKLFDSFKETDKAIQLDKMTEVHII